jgi:Permease for cytosine/purines, uracil, thiamine, allantoin
VAICQFLVGYRALVVSEIAIWTMLCSKQVFFEAPSHCSHRCRSHHHRSGHGFEWDHRCKAPCLISGLEPIVVWLLVELFYRCKSSHTVLVLVWYPGKLGNPDSMRFNLAKSTFKTFVGSECVYQMLKAIWPSISSLPNHLPVNANIVTSGMVCYVVYWLIQFPFMFVSPQMIRHLFKLKALIVPATWLAMLIWAFVKVPTHEGLFKRHLILSGSELSWAWLSALNSAVGSYSAMTVNIPDFTVSNLVAP